MVDDTPEVLGSSSMTSRGQGSSGHQRHAQGAGSSSGLGPNGGLINLSMFSKGSRGGRGNRDMSRGGRGNRDMSRESNRDMSRGRRG